MDMCVHICYTYAENNKFSIAQFRQVFNNYLGGMIVFVYAYHNNKNEIIYVGSFKHPVNRFQAHCKELLL